MRCVKCGQEIYESNHDVRVDKPDVETCWHTVADDEPLCPVHDESTDPGVRYFHRPSAVDRDSLLETLDVLSTPGALEGIREGAADIAAGRFVTLDELRAEFGLPRLASAG